MSYKLLKTVCHLDFLNSNSYSGEPTTNLSYNYSSTLNQGYDWNNSGNATTNTNDTSITKPLGLPDDYYIRSAITTEAGSQHRAAGYTTSGISGNTQYSLSVYYWQSRAGVGRPYMRSPQSNTNLGYLRYKGSSTPSNWPVQEWVRCEMTGTTGASDTALYISNYIGSQVDDKVAYYMPQIEQKDGTTKATGPPRVAVQDLSGRGNDGNLSNTTFTNNTWEDKINWGSSWVQVDSSTDLYASNDRTIEMWAKIPSADSNRTPLAVFANGTSSTNRMWLGIQSDHFQMHGWGTTDFQCTTNIVDNNWHHLVCSYDYTNQKMYMWVDGVLEVDAGSQVEGGIVPQSGQNWYLGYFPGPYDYWNEYCDVGTEIAKFSQYNKVLSHNEVLDIYKREHSKFNTPMVEGEYFPYTRPTPLLYEFNCLSRKSNRGRPVTNVWGHIDNASSIRPYNTPYYTWGDWPDDVPKPPENIGKVYKFTSGALSSTWSGNSYGYMLQDIATTNAETYTLSGWVYVSRDCNISTAPMAIEQEASGESTPTGYNYTYDMTKKGTWQKLARKAVADTQVRFLFYPRRNGVTDGSFTGFFMWGGPQVEIGSYVSPYTQDTKTVGVVNLADRSDIGTMYKTGTYDYPYSYPSDYNGIVCQSGNSADEGNHVVLTTNVHTSGNPGTKLASWEFWYKKTSENTTEEDIIFCKEQCCEMKDDNGDLQIALYATNQSWYWFNTGVDITIGTIYHVVTTYDGNEVKCYVNGTLRDTEDYPDGGLLNVNSNPYKWNARGTTQSSTTNPGNHTLYIFRIYDRVLKPHEVKSNYNREKDLFGV